MMNGGIWLQSSEGHGSTFCFTAELDTAGLEQVEPPAEEPALEPSRRLKILLVDDSLVTAALNEATISESPSAASCIDKRLSRAVRFVCSSF